MPQCKCGSYAINHHHHGRDGDDGHLCDVCYWRTRAELLRAERDALRAALHTCLWAMRQPLNDWKGDCERKAMDKANAALAQIEQERSK